MFDEISRLARLGQKDSISYGIILDIHRSCVEKFMQFFTECCVNKAVDYVKDVAKEIIKCMNMLFKSGLDSEANEFLPDLAKFFANVLLCFGSEAENNVVDERDYLTVNERTWLETFDVLLRIDSSFPLVINDIEQAMQDRKFTAKFATELQEKIHDHRQK